MADISKGETTSVLTVFLLMFVCSLIIPNLPLEDPLTISLESRFSPPSLEHFLGTDELGRDILSRVLHGAATTLQVSLFALISSLCIGIFMGAVSGYFYKTWVDDAFNWIVSLIFSLPFLLILVAFLSLMESSLFNAYLVLTAVMWVNPARIGRAEVIRTRNLLYVTVFKAYGASEIKILTYAVLPACMRSAVIFSLGYFPEIIGLEAGLSFLGLGVQPPNPGLGKMIFDGLDYLYSAWWLPIVPAALLGLIVFLINRSSRIWE